MYLFLKGLCVETCATSVTSSLMHRICPSLALCEQTLPRSREQAYGVGIQEDLGKQSLRVPSLCYHIYMIFAKLDCVSISLHDAV